MTTQVTSTPKPADRARRSSARTGRATPRTPSVVSARRRPGVWGLGVALIAVGAAVAAAAVLSSGAKHGVLTVVRAVPQGRVITGGDLGTASLPSNSGLSPLPVTSRAAVVGRRAAVDLLPGTLLTAGALSSQGIPAAGKSLVGVALKPGSLPTRPLQRGDHVELVTVATTTASSTSATQPAGGQARGAIVDAESAPGQDGTVTVDVVVSQQQAAGIAVDAAAGRLSLVLMPGTTG
jgi:hypothetical protein